jgi:hypothetical protein
VGQVTEIDAEGRTTVDWGMSTDRSQQIFITYTPDQLRVFCQPPQRQQEQQSEAKVSLLERIAERA